MPSPVSLLGNRQMTGSQIWTTLQERQIRLAEALRAYGYTMSCVPEAHRPRIRDMATALRVEL